MALDFDTYLSPFTWRYGSPEMREIWSETHKRRLWRQIWLALAEAEADFGLVSAEQLDDLRSHVAEIDVERALEIEASIHHDLMAELKTFAEQSSIGGGILHLGATSADIEDNADVLRIGEALNRLLRQLEALLLDFAAKIETWADIPMIAFTHLQPAEPTTLGYRMGIYAQDLHRDWENLLALQRNLRGKGLRGAVGTGASFADLVGVEGLPALEKRLADLLALSFYPLTSQIYPRKQDFEVINGLAGLGASLHKFAFDLRFLQSPAVGEISEPFSPQQVGSTAMPFKRNPIQAEKIDSLGRQLAQLPRLAWDNAAHSLLERTLDDSANRRTLLPEAFLCADELLLTTQRIFSGLRIDQASTERNLAEYAPFAAIERIMMALVKAGADRQAMHEKLRQHAMAAWDALQSGKANPLAENIASDPVLRAYLSEQELSGLMNVRSYLGDAPQRARLFAGMLRQSLA